MKAHLAMLACTCALLSACGDDLEDRNKAAQEILRQAGGTERPAGSTNRTPPRVAQTAPARVERSAPVVEEPVAEPEVLEVEAAPESFIDDAQGFSTDPIDDTAGFDPAPVDDPDLMEEETNPDYMD